MGQPASHAFHHQVWYVALVVHVVTAWFSSGYYAADEHYQVIAFAQHKLGELSVEELPWEYDARIRSGFLPGIAYTVIGASRTWLTANPFHIAFALRLITALFALVAVRTFVRAAMVQVSEDLQRPFILLSCFLWFLPYQHVRLAAETWAGLLFLLGISGFVGASVRNVSWLVAGICFGLCVQMKPAMLVACGGAMGWALLRSDTRGRSFIRLLSGGAIALALGVAVDSWFYGEPMHTLWNYVYKNSLSISKVDPLPVASETYPWFYYFPWIIKYGIWPIGAVLLAALFWLTYRAPRSLLVWCIWPYLVLVSAIPHKELRFLFPLMDLIPLMLVLAWHHAGNSRVIRVFEHRAVLITLIAINMLGLLVASSTAAGSGRTRLAAILYGNQPLQAGSLGYDLDDDLLWKARIPPFYLPLGITDIGINDPCAMANDLPPTPTSDLLIAEEDRCSSCTPEGLGYRPIGRSETTAGTFLLDLYNSERPGPYFLYTNETRTSHPSEP